VAAVCRALAAGPCAETVEHVIVHTGQHYDAQMSDVFFTEMGIPKPLANLAVGSATHAAQTAEILLRLEPVLIEQQPDWVILYGDTNSTLAGALAASKLRPIRIVHLEAGLRSFNREMPEEVNRTVADHLSDLLLCPSELALANLTREGLAGKAVITGDVMLDAFLAMRDRASGGCAGAEEHSDFALATVHRQENTDDRGRLREILNGLEEIARTVCRVVVPLHPRTRKAAASVGWRPDAVTVVDPLSYREMLALECRARMVLTDSGGVQKEAYFAQRPCITLRDETEWPETLTNRCNVLVGADSRRIVEAARAVGTAGPWLPIYGDGRAGEAAVDAIVNAS
jgi:UDP-GlcNAc3NAcA epimerase